MSSDGPRTPRSGDRRGPRGAKKSRSGPPRGAKKSRSGPPRGAKKSRSGPPRGAKKGRPPGRGPQKRGGPVKKARRPPTRGPAGGDGPRGPRPRTERDEAKLAGPNSWGRVARRGAGGIDEPDRDAAQRPPPKKRPDRSPERPDRRPPPGRSLPGADDLRRTAAGAVDRARGAVVRERRPLGARPQHPVDPATALTRLVGSPRDTRLRKRLEDAGRAFEAERYKDARGLLVAVVKDAPSLPEGRELMGLSLYRLGRWAEAIEELEEFRDLTASTEQHPVLADCHRALGRWADVDALWEELGEASPAPELVTEGRIVAAGAKADQGDVAGAIRLLEKGWRLPKRPRPDHLRRAYALADLYDRAGRSARARELFAWVEGHDPRLADVKARLRALR